MDWDKLKIFHAVAKAGSLTGAAKTLNLSQSVISRHISNLEESLGVSLFNRHARGLILTEQGEILFETATDISQKLLRTEERLHDTQNLPEGSLKVTVSEFIGCTWLVPKIARFRQKYPKIQLSIVMDDKFLNLNMKEADAAIRLEADKTDGLVQNLLTTIHFHICASKDYLDEYGRPESIKDLEDHYLIGYPKEGEAPFENPNWLLKKASVGADSKHRVLRMNSMYAIQKAVSTGGGIAALPHYLIEENKELEIILPKISPPSVDMFFLYADEQQNSKRTELFRDFLLKNVQKTHF